MKNKIYVVLLVMLVSTKNIAFGAHISNNNELEKKENEGRVSRMPIFGKIPENNVIDNSALLHTTDLTLKHILNFLEFREIETLACVNLQLNDVMKKEKIDKIVEEQLKHLKRQIRFYTLMKLPLEIYRPSIILRSLIPTLDIVDRLKPDAKFSSNRRLAKTFSKFIENQKQEVDATVLAKAQYLYPWLKLRYQMDSKLQNDHSAPPCLAQFTSSEPQNLGTNRYKQAEGMATLLLSNTSHSLSIILNFVNFRDLQALVCVSHQFKNLLEEKILHKVIQFQLTLAATVAKLIPIQDSLEIIHDIGKQPFGFPIYIGSSELMRLDDKNFAISLETLHFAEHTLLNDIQNFNNSDIQKYFNGLNRYEVKKQKIDKAVYEYIKRLFPSMEFKYPIKVKCEEKYYSSTLKYTFE